VLCRFKHLHDIIAELSHLSRDCRGPRKSAKSNRGSVEGRPGPPPRRRSVESGPTPRASRRGTGVAASGRQSVRKSTSIQQGDPLGVERRPRYDSNTDKKGSWCSCWSGVAEEASEPVDLVPLDGYAPKPPKRKPRRDSVGDRSESLSRSPEREDTQQVYQYVDKPIGGGGRRRHMITTTSKA